MFSKKFLTIFISIFLLFSSIFIISVSSEQIAITSSGTTFYVDDSGGADFAKIQDAINASSDGDTVFVYNGTYYGNIVLNKSITLQGENNQNTIIKDNMTDSNSHESKFAKHPTILMINAENVKIANFKIASNISEISTYLFFAGCTNCEIINNYFVGCRLKIFEGSNNKIRNNLFKSDYTKGGVSLDSSDFNQITNNSFISLGGALSLLYCEGNTIEYNKIQDCLGGISLADPFDDFECNKIRYNDFLSIKIIKAVGLPSGSIWRHNYWGRPRVIPKLIIGGQRGYIPPGVGGPSLPVPPLLFFDFDWFPAKTPNCDF